MHAEDLTPILSTTYLAICIAGFSLLLLAEAAVPLDPVESESERTRHVLRNFSLWVLAVLLGDCVVGSWLLDIPGRMWVTTAGLLHNVLVPFPALIVAGVLLVDFGEYVFHRLCHSNRWLWLIHATHHSDDRVDVSTALRFHPVETALNLTWKTGLLWVCGLPMWLVAARGLLMLPGTLIQHANVRLPDGLDRAMRWVFITPALHRIHHSPLAAENNSDFGEVFSFWDRMFGTLRHVQEKSFRYGLPNLCEDRWHTLRGMLLTPITARQLSAL